MDRNYLRRLLISDATELLNQLTTRQHVRPHRSLDDVLQELAMQAGICQGAVARAIAWLDLDPLAAIGRLRRTELSQLARSLHRFWRQTPSEGAVADASQVSQSSLDS